MDTHENNTNNPGQMSWDNVRGTMLLYNFKSPPPPYSILKIFKNAILVPVFGPKLNEKREEERYACEIFYCNKLPSVCKIEL